MFHFVPGSGILRASSMRLILNHIIDAIYGPNAYIIGHNYMCFASMSSILNISKCSRVAICHPPGIVHWDPILDE